MSDLYPYDSPESVLLRVEKFTPQDYTSVISLADAKNWLRVDSSVDDNDIVEIIEGAIIQAETETNTAICESDNSCVFKAYYSCLVDNELLPFVWADNLVSITLDGDVLDISDYSIVAGRIRLPKTLSGNVVVEYTSYVPSQTKYKTAIKQLMEADYDRDGDKSLAYQTLRKLSYHPIIF